MAGKIGISKRQLLEDYYYDEIPIIFEKYAELNNHQEEIEEVGWDQIGI